MNNYLAWRVDVNGFSRGGNLAEKIKYFLRFAVLAPSSHNSQPWSFEIGENFVDVYKNQDRKLPFSDSDDRQLYISLGCAIENLTIASDYYGYETMVEYKEDTGKSVYARISFSEKVNRDFLEKDNRHLIFSIPRRVNNRNRYTSSLKLESFTEEIQKAPIEARLDLVTDQKTKDVLARSSVEAGIEAMSHPQFREELSHYVKNNLTKSSVGMPGFGLGVPTPVSFFLPFLVKNFNMNALSKGSDFKLLSQYTPVIGIISTKEDNPISWMNAGRFYERIALMATREGFSTAVLAASIQIGEHYKTIQNELGINERPQVFFRLGYAKKGTRYSPRVTF